MLMPVPNREGDGSGTGQEEGAGCRANSMARNFR